MNKNKFYKRIVLSLVVVFTIAACTGGGTTTTPTPTPNQQNQGNVILIWWNMFEPEENVRPLIDAYEALHPNVDIQYDEKGTTEGVAGYKETLNTVLDDNDKLSTPDIFTVHNTWVGRYDKYISKATNFSTDELNDFYNIVKQDFASDGVSGVPLYVDSLGLIYNKDKLIANGYTVPSQDWTAFQTQAVNLTQKGNSNSIVSAGFSANLPSNTEFNFELINLLMLQNGVSMVDSTAKKATFADDSQIRKSQSAFSFLSEFSSGSKTTWNKDFKKDIASFLEKKLAMYAAPSWRLQDILEYNETFNLGLNVGVAPMPQLGGDEEIGWASYWGQTVSKDSSNAEVAWDFIKFITEVEQLKLLNDTVEANGRPFGILYPRTSMAAEITNNSEVKDILSPYLQGVSRAKSWPMFDGDLVEGEFNEFFNSSGQIEQIASGVTEILTTDDEN